MKSFLGFTGNLLLAIIFGLDGMAYYLKEGVSIFNNDVNRPFIIWLGLIVSLYSASYFLDEYNKYKNK